MVLKYPGAKWEPLGPQTEAAMTAHDILCFHTMVGSLAGTSNMFHQNGYGGTESHFGVGAAGETEQWQDGMYSADANLDGWDRVVSIETADYGGVFGTWNTGSADNVPAWTDAQLDRLVDMTVWFCRKETHANCPSSWNCHKAGVPCVLIPDTKQGRRGIGYHKQGCDPWRVADGEKWSTAYGKGCPGPKRIAQLITIVIPRARQILGGDPGEIDMAIADDILRELRALQIDFNGFQTLYTGRWTQEIEEARAQNQAALDLINNLVAQLATEEAEEDQFDQLTGERWAQSIREAREQAAAAQAKLDAILTAHQPPPATLPKA
jgi:hypothetical protein